MAEKRSHGTRETAGADTGNPVGPIPFVGGLLAREMYDSGNYTVRQIADEIGVTRPTFYRRLDSTAGAQG